MSSLEMLATRLASSQRRRSVGSAAAPAKASARALSALAARESRDAVTAERERMHTERTEGLRSAMARVSQYRLLLANESEGTDRHATLSARLSDAQSDVTRLYALPILPSDIRPNGRFARSVTDHLSRHASHIRHGSMLATTASADDIVSEGLALCYAGLTHDDGSPRYELIEVDTADWVTGNAPVMVPTLGALYRAVRRAYWNELSKYRAMLSGRVTITSLDALSVEDVRAAESLDSFGIATVNPETLYVDAPATLAADYWESVATRRPTIDDARLADALNVRESADAERAEREHARNVFDARQSMAAGAHPFGMQSADANAALVDSATAAVVAEHGLDAAAQALGVTPLTITRRLDSIRIRRAPDGTLVLARIAPDARPRRTTRVQRLTARHGREVSVSRDGTVATPVRMVTVPVGSTHAPRMVRSVSAHNMPMVSTGVPNWNAGDHVSEGLTYRLYRERVKPIEGSPWVEYYAPDAVPAPYLAMVSERAHASADKIVPNDPSMPERGNAGALMAATVRESDRVRRIAERHARVYAERVTLANDATTRRLRFLTIARAVRNGLVTVV